MATSACGTLTDPPYGFLEYGPLSVAISGNEFLTVTHRDKVYKYSTSNNQWCQMGTLRFRVGTDAKCAYDEENNALYVNYAGDSYNHISVQKCSFKKKNLCPSDEFILRNSFELNRINTMIIVEDHLHLVGYRNGDFHHIVIDKSTKNVIKEPLTIRHDTQSLGILSEIIFLPSKRRLIAYGLGFNGATMICEHSLEANEWIVRETLKRWFVGSPAMVATVDERYIISFGESEFMGTDWHRIIMIYDVQNDTFTESHLKLPKSGDVGSAVLLADPKRDELLIFGFVNQSFLHPSFKSVQILPRYLIQMMTKWLSFETVHLFWNRPDFGVNRSVHWTINIDDILRAVL